MCFGYTLASVINAHDEARKTRAYMPLGGIHTFLITSTILYTTLSLTTTPLPGLILEPSAVVLGVADELNGNALLPFTTVKFCFEVTLKYS